AAAQHDGIEVGVVAVQAHAAVDLPLLAEADRVEGVRGDGIGPAAAGGARPAPLESGHARIRVVEVRGRPGRAVQRADAGGVELLAAELHAGAQVVPHVAGTELRGQVGVVGDD